MNDLASKVLKGDTRAIDRMITLIENNDLAAIDSNKERFIIDNNELDLKCKKGINQIDVLLIKKA